MTIHAPAAPSQSTRFARPTGWVPYALVALSGIPVIAGTLRLVEVVGGPHVMPPNPRIAASPAPVVVHILSVIPYALLGAFQFSSRLRRRRPGWHRATGRVLVGLGLAVALSGLWMTIFYPRQTGTGELAHVFRLAAGSAMAACIVLGFDAIRHGNIGRHQAWMTRAYALALGAGTQVLTGTIAGLLPDTVVVADLALGAGWVVNLAVAEYVIGRGRRQGRPRTLPRATAKAGAP